MHSAKRSSEISIESLPTASDSHSLRQLLAILYRTHANRRVARCSESSLSLGVPKKATPYPVICFNSTLKECLNYETYCVPKLNTKNLGRWIENWSCNKSIPEDTPPPKEVLLGTLMACVSSVSTGTSPFIPISLLPRRSRGEGLFLITKHVKTFGL